MALATAEQIGSLTRNPLETLCARFQVDSAISGKKKDVLVQRLVALKQVTVAQVEELKAARAGGSEAQQQQPRRRPSQGAAASIETKRRLVETYIAEKQAESELRCESCGYPLIHVFEYPQNFERWGPKEPRVTCNRRSFGCNHKVKLSDAYVQLLRLLTPRITLEVESLRLAGDASDTLRVSATQRDYFLLEVALEAAPPHRIQQFEQTGGAAVAEMALERTSLAREELDHLPDRHA